MNHKVPCGLCRLNLMDGLEPKNCKCECHKGGKMKNAVLAILCSSLLAGCSVGDAAKGKLIAFAGNDLDRTVALAEQYGKPEVAKCAKFLSAALHSKDELLAKIEALRNEETSGLFSAALKAALLAEMVRSLDDPAQRAAMEAGFREACSAVAGDIMIDLARDAAKIGSRSR